MMRYFVVLFSLLFFCVPVFANVYDYPSDIESISKQLPNMGNIKCKFKQEKYLQNIANPVISGGDFEFIENKGVYFYTQYPIKSTVDYTNKNFKQINDIVNAISAKKYARLEKDFSFYYTNNKNGWTLGLKPKNTSDISKFIASITIDGSDYIHKMNLLQTNGNKTILWFTK